VLFTLCCFINSWAQEKTDPLKGNYTLGNSAELVTLWPQQDGNTSHLKVYDFTDSKTITGATVKDYSAEWALGGNKQMDLACGDFNGDGYEELVAVWEGSDNSLKMVIPRMVQGTLWWSDEHKISFPANTLYGQSTYLTPSTIRVVKGQFDHDGEDEFLLAYWGNDENIHLTVYNTTADLIPQAAGSIADAKLDKALDAQAVFDVACGDFNGDGIDEVILARSVPGGAGRQLMLRIYSYNPLTKEFALKMADQLIYETNVHLRQVALATGDFNGDGLAEAVITFNRFSYRWESIWEGLTRYNYFWVRNRCMIHTINVNPNLTEITLGQDVPQIEYEKEEFHLKRLWGSSTTVHYVPKPMSLISADLNNDGRDEILSLSMGWLRIYQPDNALKLDEGIHQSVAHKYYDASRRTVVVADLDAKASNASQVGWFPEIIVTEWANDNTRQLRVFGPTIGTGGKFNTIHQIPDNNYKFLDQFKHYDRIALAFAVGNFDGDGVKLGTPRHYTKTMIQPTTIICAPPLHYDIFDDTVYDVTGCYTAGGAFRAEYTRSISEVWQIQTELRSDWGVSASVGGSVSVLGYSASAYLSARYGQGFSKTYFASTTITGQTNIATTFDDKIYATVNSYDLWEYPICGDGTIIPDEYVLVVVPSVVQDANFWFDSKSKGEMGKLYVPNHETGNIFSYYKDGDLTSYEGIDEVVYGTESFTLASGSSHWNVNFNHFTGSTDFSYYQVAMQVGASVSAYGLQVAVAGDYSLQGLVTTTVTVHDGLNFDVYLGNVPADAAYTVRPFLYWAENGALVLDYAATPETFTGEKSWWQLHYEDNPDLSFILPWRYDYEKKLALTDNDRHRTRDISFEPDHPNPGDTVTVRVCLHNFSLKNCAGTVDLKFYIGDPEKGGTLISSIDGDTLFSTYTSLPAREQTTIEFQWIIPQNIPYYPRIYAVIDPDDTIIEVHKNNNKGFRILEVEGLISIEHPPQTGIPDNFSLEQNYPNPFNPVTTIKFALPKPCGVNLTVYNLLGQEIKTIVMATLEAGFHQAQWDGADKNGFPVSSGMYVYQLKSGDFVKTKKMILLR